jgi:hypothetical protein
VRVQDINDWTSFLRRVHHLVPKSGSPTSALNGMGLKAASSQSLVDLLQNTFPRY